MQLFPYIFQGDFPANEAQDDALIYMNGSALISLMKSFIVLILIEFNIIAIQNFTDSGIDPNAISKKWRMLSVLDSFVSLL